MIQKLNRRDFLKISSSAAVAMSAFPWLSIFNEKSYGRSPSDKVRLGFIGVGDRGKYLLLSSVEILQKLNIEIVAICDDYEPNYRNAIEISGNTNIKAFYDYRKMLELKDVDAVIIATPLHEHAGMTVDALKAGKHVFCEKAMARTFEDIKLMYDTHIENNRILQIGHQRLFDPKYVRAIELVRSGEIGQIGQIRAYWHRNHNWRRAVPKKYPELEKKINWRLYKEYSAGLLTELASHQIQVANWAMGMVPKSVVGNGSIIYWKDGREVFDNLALIFNYENGTQFIYDSMTSNKKYGLEEQILGKRGTVELETNKIFYESPPPASGIRQLIHNMEKGLFETVPIGGASWVPETAIQYEGDYISDKYDLDESQLQIEAFVNFIRKGESPRYLIDEAYNASIWSLLAEEAINNNKKLIMPSKFVI